MALSLSLWPASTLNHINCRIRYATLNFALTTTCTHRPAIISTTTFTHCIAISSHTDTMSQQQGHNTGGVPPFHWQLDPIHWRLNSEAAPPEQVRQPGWFLASLAPCPNAATAPRTMPKTPDCRCGPRTPEERAMFENAIAASSGGPPGPGAGSTPRTAPRTIACYGPPSPRHPREEPAEGNRLSGLRLRDGHTLSMRVRLFMADDGSAPGSGYNNGCPGPVGASASSEQHRRPIACPPAPRRQKPEVPEVTEDARRAALQAKLLAFAPAFPAAPRIALWENFRSTPQASDISRFSPTQPAHDRILEACQNYDSD